MDKQHILQLARQIVWEHPNWENDGGHIISDTLESCSYCEDIPPDGDTLFTACNYVKKHKEAGLGYYECCQPGIVKNFLDTRIQ